MRSAVHSGYSSLTGQKSQDEHHGQWMLMLSRQDAHTCTMYIAIHINKCAYIISDSETYYIHM